MSAYFQPAMSILASVVATCGLLGGFAVYRHESDPRMAKAFRLWLVVSMACFIICLVFSLMLGAWIVPTTRGGTLVLWAIWIIAYQLLFLGIAVWLAVAGLKAMR
jgi:hypothetical protein